MPVFNSLFSVSFELFNNFSPTEITDSGFNFSKTLKFLSLFSITHWVIPK